MDGAEATDQTRVMVERFRAMGLEVDELPGGRAATVTLPVGEEAFPGLQGERSIKEIRLATVGNQAIKCLQPRCLFFLPLIPVSDCTEAEEIERRIRSAWREQVARLRRGRDALERLGVEWELESGDAVLSFDLGTGDPTARARTSDLGEVVLPARGPLSGQHLASADERLFQPDSRVDSGLDLQIAITTHLERLSRLAAKRDQERRAEAAREHGRPVRRVQRRSHRVLLVGPHLAANTALAESLRMRGYEVTAAPSDVEAMDAFCASSYELMLVDSKLGRADGLELVPLIQTLAGIEKLPVVIVDDRARDAVRDRARKIGAVGYLTAPVDAARIAPGLARLLQAPRFRRYSRYAHRVAVRCGTLRVPGFTTAIGRLGMFVSTGLESRLHTLDWFEIAVPTLGEPLRVECETVYLRGATSDEPGGIGLRFHEFAAGDEERLITYLRSLEAGD